jgi:hypothetical protein
MKTVFGGTFATIATFTLGEWNHLVGLGVGLLTIACLVPVAVHRWKKFLRGEAQPPDES